MLNSDKFKGVTLGQYLKRGWYSRVFCSKYLLPMCAAIWSVPTASVLDFPVQVRRLSANPERRLTHGTAEEARANRLGQLTCKR